MAEPKTKLNDASVDAFIDAVDDADKREFARVVSKMMSEATGEVPKMWGSSIVGFGSYTYVYASGRSGDWMEVGFSPRKANMTLYIMPGFEIAPKLMEELGKYKTGKSCLYVKRMSDIDLDVLRELIDKSVEVMRTRYGSPEAIEQASQSKRKKKAASKEKTASKKKAASKKKTTSKKKAASKKNAASKKKAASKKRTKR